MNLVKMLPFLDDESKNKMIEDIKDGTLDLGQINLTKLYPFLNDTQLENLAKAIVDKDLSISLTSLLPFANEHLIDTLLTYHEEGKLDGFNIEHMYPFLSKNQMARLFDHAYSKMKEESQKKEPTNE